MWWDERKLGALEKVAGLAAAYLREEVWRGGAARRRSARNALKHALAKLDAKGAEAPPPGRKQSVQTPEEEAMTPEEMDEIVRKVLEAMSGPVPVEPAPATTPPQPTLITDLNELWLDITHELREDIGDEGIALLAEGVAHYVAMYEAFSGVTASTGERARSFALAWTRGQQTDTIAASATGSAIAGLLNSTLASGISSPKVRLESPHPVTGKTERNINIGEEWLYEPRTGGSGQLPPTPVNP